MRHANPLIFAAKSFMVMVFVLLLALPLSNALFLFFLKII